VTRLLNRDVVLALIVLVVGAVYLVEAAKIPTSALSDNVGAGGFPTVIGWALTIAAAGLVVRALTTPAGTAEHHAAEPESAAAADAGDVWAEPGRATRRAAGLAAIAAGFLLLLPYAGYLVCVALMIFAIAVYMGRPPAPATAGVAAGGAVFLWGLFVLLLDIPLPSGSWWRALF
jgi:small-conductance mechanosensitive channel